jgi:diadenosine tetraphosphate (Ap4A) HIT family hydrolase
MGHSERDELWRRHFDVKADRLLYADDHVVAFRDRTPRGAAHVLVVPRFEELIGVEALAPHHLPLLAHMESIARRLTPSAAPADSSSVSDEQLVLGFHRRPLRSVPFLHLHSIRPPFTSMRNKIPFMKLPVGALGFISLGDVVRRLSRNATHC